MKHLIISAVMALAAPGAAMAESQQARIEVSGLYCPSCSYIAGEALKQEPSVELIDLTPSATGDTAVYVVIYDDAVTSLENIIARPISYGYEARLAPDASGS
jgi:mercuric ion binding protein